jgi:hypothetical protein
VNAVPSGAAFLLRTRRSSDSTMESFRDVACDSGAHGVRLQRPLRASVKVVNSDSQYLRSNIGPGGAAKSVSVAAGAACCVLGAVTMAAWHAHTVSLLIVTRRSTPMRYNAALLFVLCGTALIAAAFNKNKLSIGCAAVTGGVAAATVLEFLLAVPFGIDDLLFKEYAIEAWTFDPRMAPNTAVAFLAASAALILLRRSSTRKIWPLVTALLASATFALGVVAGVGYAAALEAAYTWGELTGMSLVAAAGLMLLGGRILSAIWAQDHVAGIPSWAPAPVGLILAATTVWLWRSLLHNRGPRGELLPAMVLAAGLIMALLTATAIRLAQTTASKNHELQALSRKLLVSEERYRSLVLATTQVVWTTDPEGLVTTDMPCGASSPGWRPDNYRAGAGCNHFTPTIARKPTSCGAGLWKRNRSMKPNIACDDVTASIGTCRCAAFR